MKLPFAKKTKTGYSTSADILEKLKKEDPIISKILDYRQFTKLKSTYAEGLAVFIESDKRIHGKLYHKTNKYVFMNKHDICHFFDDSVHYRK